MTAIRMSTNPITTKTAEVPIVVLVLLGGRPAEPARTGGRSRACRGGSTSTREPHGPTVADEEAGDEQEASR